MGSLVYSAIAKGLGDLGSVIGSGMQRQAELEFQAVREDQREARALEKAKALKQFEEDLKEQAAKKDAEIYSQAKTNAQEVGVARTAAQLEKDSGALAANAERMPGASPAATQDEMKRHLESLSPEQRKLVGQTGLIAQPMSRLREEMQGYEDLEAETRKLGGSSTLMKELQATKKARLDEIRLENLEKKEDNRSAEERAREERREREGRERADSDSRRAGAAETQARAAEARANRDPEAKDKRERLTTMINSANATIKSLNDGSRGKTPEEKADWQRQMGEAKWLRDKATQQLKASFDDKPAPSAEKPKPGDEKPKPAPAPAPKPGDNGNVKPGAYKVGETKTVQAGPNKGRTAEWDGNGWVLK